MSKCHKCPKWGVELPEWFSCDNCWVDRQMQEEMIPLEVTDEYTCPKCGAELISLEPKEAQK